MPVEISYRYITKPGQLSEYGVNPIDGIGFMVPGDVWVHDCVVDFSNLPLAQQDEAASMTYGASGLWERCVIRGANKLFLIGSGDVNAARAESSCRIVLRDCILENCCRRAPEVQAGITVILERCIISDWANPKRFDARPESAWKDRGFGAWAHSGGAIVAVDCLFLQKGFWRGWQFMLRDWLTHIGQAVRERGMSGLLYPGTYLPGVTRGLTSGPGGYVAATGCWKNVWWIRLENSANPASDAKALGLLSHLEKMRSELMANVVFGKSE